MSEKRGGVLKYVLGCGCLLVLTALVGSGLAAWFVYEQVAAVDWDKTLDPASYADKVNTDMFADYGLDIDAIGDAMARPMGEDDADRFLAAHEWFYAQPEAGVASNLLDDVSDGFELEDVLQFWERQNELMGLMGRFDDYIHDNGGYLKQTDSAVRAIGTTAAVEAVAQATGADPASDAIAAKVTLVSSEAHSKVKDTSPAAIAKVLSEQELAGFKVDTALASRAKPGIVALSRMPTASFKNWSKLSKKKRQRLVDAYQKQRKFVIATHLNPVLNTAQVITTIQGTL